MIRVLHWEVVPGNTESVEVRHEGSLSKLIPTVGSWGSIPLGTSESQCSQEGGEPGCVYTCSTGHCLRLPLTTLFPAWFSSAVVNVNHLMR